MATPRPLRSSISAARRPNPVANAAHESSVTWTGVPQPDVRTAIGAVLNGGSKLHEQRTTDVPVEQQLAAADFVLGLSFAQIFDWRAGALDAAGARGGPFAINGLPFHVGINALTGDPVTGLPFDHQSFTIYDAWEDLDTKTAHPSFLDRARATIARGEEAFYSLQFDITGVAGLNDDIGQPTIRGTCTTCHNTPDIGSHSVVRLLDEGVADASRRSPRVPLLTVVNKTTGETRQTTDLGRATSTGKWVDIGKVKVPTLRGLASRPPYFHDGSAATLRDVLEFYERRFNIDFKGDKEAILAFLDAT
jgi:hypothetical protein